MPFVLGMFFRRLRRLGVAPETYLEWATRAFHNEAVSVGEVWEAVNND